MAHLTQKYFRLYQEGFERSFGYGKAFLHQDLHSSPGGASSISSAPKTPKSILKASKQSGFKSQKRICINESLNQTRRFSLRSDGSDTCDDRKKPFNSMQALDAEPQGQRFHTAPDASIDSDSDLSAGHNEDGMTESGEKWYQTSLDEIERSSVLYNSSGMNSSSSDIYKSGLSEVEKDYIRTLQKAREQQMHNQVLRKPEQPQGRTSPNMLTGSRLMQNSQTNFNKEEKATPNRKNSYASLHSAKAKPIGMINPATPTNKISAQSPRPDNFSSIKAQIEKINENFGKENVQSGIKISPKAQKTLAETPAKIKYENLEERIQQLKEENKHLREKLDQKKKDEAKNAANKSPIGRDVRQQQDKIYLKKSDQSSYVARIIMSSQEQRSHSKNMPVYQTTLQKTSSTTNLRDPRSQRPSLGSKTPQGMSSSSTGFYRSPDNAFRSGRNI